MYEVTRVFDLFDDSSIVRFLLFVLVHPFPILDRFRLDVYRVGNWAFSLMMKQPLEGVARLLIGIRF